MTQSGAKPQQERQDRSEFGHDFKWNAESGEWETTSGRKVYVRPSNPDNSYWVIRVPSTYTEHTFTGNDAEARAFCVAEGYSRQAD
jgi:hypothetical protein